MAAVAPMEARGKPGRNRLRGMNRIFPFLFGEVGLTYEVFEEWLHDFPHFFRVKLNAEDGGVLVFDGLYNPIGRASRYAEKGRHTGDGLNVAGVDYETSHAQYVAQARAFLQFDGMVACSPFVAVHEAIRHISLHIGVYAAPIKGIE